MLYLRNTIFWITLILLTISVWLISLPAYLIPGRWGRIITQWFQTQWAHGFLVLCRYICGLKVSVKNLADLPPNTKAIYACRHESAWETMAFLYLLPPSSVVLKQQLRWIPIYGWHAMRSGMIPINRKAGQRALRKMQNAAIEAIQQGNNILIFPEGTRANPYEKLPLQSGLYALYKELHCPVVPVSHNAGQYWPKKRLLLKPGTIMVTIHPAVMYAANKQDLNKQVVAYF